MGISPESCKEVFQHQRLTKDEPVVTGGKQGNITLNQQNEQCSSLDICIIMPHSVFLHVTVQKGSPSGNQYETVLHNTSDFFSIHNQRSYERRVVKCRQLLVENLQIDAQIHDILISLVAAVTDTILYLIIIITSPQRHPYFDVVAGLVWSYDPESYAGSSVCYW